MSLYMYYAYAEKVKPRHRDLDFNNTLQRVGKSIFGEKTLRRLVYFTSPSIVAVLAVLSASNPRAFQLAYACDALSQDTTCSRFRDATYWEPVRC